MATRRVLAVPRRPRTAAGRPRAREGRRFLATRTRLPGPDRPRHARRGPRDDAHPVRPGGDHRTRPPPRPAHGPGRGGLAGRARPPRSLANAGRASGWWPASSTIAAARAKAPFLVVDAAALAPELLEPRAVVTSRKVGTVFIAHADRLPRDIQARLVASVDSSRIRLLCGTAIDPEQALRDERWREDFTFSATVQVLRLAHRCARADRTRPPFARPALPRIGRRPVGTPHRRVRSRGDRCPESVRLARQRAGTGPGGGIRPLARDGSRLLPDDLPAEIRGAAGGGLRAPISPPPPTPLDEWLTRLERRLIEQALQRARHNKSRAAELLDISRPRLYRRIKELGIPDADSPDEANGRED